MDMIILVAAFVAFFALVAAWIVAPTGGKPVLVAEPGTLNMSEARA
jgi:hypothetical protein